MRWFAIGAAIVLMVACFFPWVLVESKDIMVSGVKAEGTSFGKPGYMHLLMASLTILLLLFRNMTMLRISIFLTAFNAAWSIRNYIVISSCYGGICPEKQIALYVVVFSSFILMICNLFIGNKQAVPGTTPEPPAAL
jgi:hypothetical protein